MSESLRDSLREGLQSIALKWAQGAGVNDEPCDWLLDCREMLLRGDYLASASRVLWERFEDEALTLVGGLSLASHPLAVGLLYQSRQAGQPVNALLIRREPKENGLKKQIEGPAIQADDRIALVEGVLDTGDTIRLALEALGPHRDQVVSVGVLVDLENAESQWLHERGIRVVSLFTLAQLGVKAPEQTCQASAIEAVWSLEGLTSSPYRSPRPAPTVHAGRLYLGTDQGALLCLSVDGREQWRFQTREMVRSTPAFHAESVYFTSYDGFLHCLDLATGEPGWQVQAGERSSSDVALHEELQLVYVSVEYGGRGGSLCAFNALNGELHWQHEATDYMQASPFVDLPRRQVIVGANDGVLRALDARRGAPRWNFEASGEITASAVVDEEGRCFFTAGDGSIYALDASSGALLWRHRLGRRLNFAPLVTQGIVVVGSDSGHVTAFDPNTGKVRWIHCLGGALVGGAAALPGGRIAIGSWNGSLAILAAISGKPLARVVLKGPFAGRPGYHEGHLYVADCEGNLSVFRLSETPGPTKAK